MKNNITLSFTFVLFVSLLAHADENKRLQVKYNAVEEKVLINGIFDVAPQCLFKNLMIDVSHVDNNTTLITHGNKTKLLDLPCGYKMNVVKKFSEIAPYGVSQPSNLSVHLYGEFFVPNLVQTKATKKLLEIGEYTLNVD